MSRDKLNILLSCVACEVRTQQCDLGITSSHAHIVVINRIRSHAHRSESKEFNTRPLGLRYGKMIIFLTNFKNKNSNTWKRGPW